MKIFEIELLITLEIALDLHIRRGRVEKSPVQVFGIPGPAFFLPFLLVGTGQRESLLPHHVQGSESGRIGIAAGGLDQFLGILKVGERPSLVTLIFLFFPIAFSAGILLITLSPIAVFITDFHLCEWFRIGHRFKEALPITIPEYTDRLRSRPDLEYWPTRVSETASRSIALAYQQEVCPWFLGNKIRGIIEALLGIIVPEHIS
jgi:hypothetical protein